MLSATDFKPGGRLAVDVGYRTTDYILVEKLANGSLDYEPSAAGSLEIGMHDINQSVAQAIHGRTSA